MESTPRFRLAKAARATTYVALAWVTINLVILVVGFFLKLFGANADAGFTEFWYRNLDRVMEPFRGIFPSADIGTTGDVQAVLDTSILFAMVVYVIVYMLIHGLVDWLNLRVQRMEIEQTATFAAPEAAAATPPASIDRYDV
ncbi:MAG: YggT family protein [Thermoleophilia bacterium]|nr:YggT family protein [Thermoleophilia bacterium]